MLFRISAGLSPSVGSKVLGSLSIPIIDRSTGSGLPVAEPTDDGATAEKAEALLTNNATMRAAENFMVGFISLWKIAEDVVPQSGVRMNYGRRFE